MARIFVKKHPIIDGQTIQCMFFLVSNNFKGCRSVKNWLIWELFWALFQINKSQVQIIFFIKLALPQMKLTMHQQPS